MAEHHDEGNRLSDGQVRLAKPPRAQGVGAAITAHGGYGKCVDCGGDCESEICTAAGLGTPRLVCRRPLLMRLEEANHHITTRSKLTVEKRHGQHYTPTDLALFLAKQTFGATRKSATKLTVLDPACGDGELLLAIGEAARTAGLAGSIQLFGYDIDGEAVAVATNRLQSAGLQAEIVHGDFLVEQRTLESASVDIIITNPPYVRTQNLGQEAARLLAAEFGLTGRVDLTHPFVTVASRLLGSGGVLGLLCSNRFLTTLAGENVRRGFMHEGLRVRELYDLGDTKLFKAAVLPAVVVASKTGPMDQPARFVSVYEQPTRKSATTQSLFEALDDTESSIAHHNGKQYEVKVGALIPPANTKTPWRLSAPESDRWLEGIERGTWKTFGDIAKIRVGIKSTADKVFLSDNWGRVVPAIEDELLLPLITQSNVTPWRIADHLEMKVLYPYDLTSSKRRVLDIEDWPGMKAYLLSHQEQLRGRRYVIQGGREWYEIWVPQRPKLWAKPKIVFPDISEQPRFALDTTGAVVNGNCYWISMDDIGDEDIAYLMLAVANSTLGVRFYDEACGNKLYSGKRRWITQYVKRLPLPDPETQEAKRLITSARSLTMSAAVDEERIAQLDRDVEAAFVASAGIDREPQAEEVADTLF